MPNIIKIHGQPVDFGDLNGAELDSAIAAATKQLAPESSAQPKTSRPVRQPRILPPGEALMQGAKRGAGSLMAGMASGAGSIGATVVSPGDMLADALLGRGEKSRNQIRREDMTEAMADAGADTGSFGYGFGKLGTEVAGTAGVGPALGAALLKTAPGFAPLAEAISTGGMGSAPLPSRAIGGAVTGGASAGLVDPEQAQAGAVVGGALPLAIPALGAVARKIGSGLSEVLGVTTGAGGEAIRQAGRAGMEGGKRAEQFTENMRGRAEMADALDAAKANLQAMREAKSAEYRAGMVDIRGDKQVLDFADIDKAINDAAGVTQYKGQVKNIKAEQVRAEIADAVNEWRSLDPAEYHTPEGFDALKQKIGAIQEKIPFEDRTSRKVAGDVYNAIKGAITKQAKAYSDVMRDYHQAESDIQEIERALSLGKKASVDTAMRKLQSLTRNNVNTNYGNRLALAEQLQQAGGQDFLPALSGQALSAWAPRGISSLAAQGVGAAGIGAGVSGVPGALAAVPILASQSPRLVGEAALKAGQVAKINRELARLLLESRAAPVIYTSGGQ